MDLKHLKRPSSHPKAMTLSFDGLPQRGRRGLALENAGDFYPRGEKPEEINYAATLHLPPGWAFATALPIEKQGNDTFQFTPVSLYGRNPITNYLSLFM